MKRISITTITTTIITTGNDAG
ncbi:thr operon leader peptide [Enterobacter cloacae]